MTIRVIVQTADAGMAANIGGPVQVWYKTFDVEAPELEAYLLARDNSYSERQVSGWEVIPNGGTK